MLTTAKSVTRKSVRSNGCVHPASERLMPSRTNSKTETWANAKWRTTKRWRTNASVASIWEKCSTMSSRRWVTGAINVRGTRTSSSTRKKISTSVIEWVIWQSTSQFCHRRLFHCLWLSTSEASASKTSSSSTRTTSFRRNSSNSWRNWLAVYLSADSKIPSDKSLSLLPSLDPVDIEELALLSAKIGVRFLFTICLHITKSVRGVVSDWYEALLGPLKVSKQARLWFCQRVLFDHAQITCFNAPTQKFPHPSWKT